MKIPIGNRSKSRRAMQQCNSWRAAIAQIAAAGVDYASAEALTHSAPNFDVALDIDA